MNTVNFLLRCAVAAAAVSSLWGCAGVSSGGEQAIQLATPGLPDAFDSAFSAGAFDGALSAGAANPQAGWDAFQDPALSQIVATVVAQNLNFQASAARVAQARAVSAQAGAAQSPQIDIGASVSRQRRSLEVAGSPNIPPSTPRTSNLWQLDSQLRWQWDAFDELKLTQMAADERVQAAVAQAAAARLLVSSEAAKTVVRARVLAQRIALAQELQALDQQQLDITNAKRRAGLSNQIPVLQAQAQWQASQGELAQLQAERLDVHSALAVLAAITPQQAAQLLGDSAQLPTAPAQIDAGVPSQLLLRRPDLLQAQAELRAVSADLASSLAARYPKFTLSAQLGWAAASAAALGSSGALLAALSPAVRWPLVDGGSAKALSAQRLAQQQEAALAYRQGVLKAFAQTQTALQTVALRRSQAQALVANASALLEAAELARIQADKGHTEQSAALLARRSSLLARGQQVLAAQQTLNAVVDVFQAVGQGWTETAAAQ